MQQRVKWIAQEENAERTKGSICTVGPGCRKRCMTP
jgi:hypothetical protein